MLPGWMISTRMPIPPSSKASDSVAPSSPDLPHDPRGHRPADPRPLRCLAEVVAEADVANGTFSNHFLDRDDFIRTPAHESLEAITTDSATDTEGADPAWRFAVAATRVLEAIGLDHDEAHTLANHRPRSRTSPREPGVSPSVVDR